MIARFVRKQIDEIRSYLELRVLGVGLALVHVTTWFFWYYPSSRYLLISSNIWDPICWPFFQSCSAWPRFSPEALRIAGYAYLALALAGALLFAWKRTVAAGYWMLIFLNAFKLYVFWQDYRLMGNYHYMAYLVSFAFLFIKNKVWCIRRLLVGFYLAAGALKFCHEWLSGAALPESWIRAGTLPAWLADHGLMPICCAYVVVLEMVFVFGLLSRKRLIFCCVFAQFVVFHLYSYWIVGWFYPLIMASLLSIFPVSFMREAKEEFAGSLLPAKIMLAAFCVTQLIPLAQPGDAALTGEGRLLALNMFDSHSVCFAKAIAQIDRTFIDVSTQGKDFAHGVRIQCDPYVYYQRAKRLCTELESQPGFKGISMSLVAKRTSDEEFKSIIALKNVCQKDIVYSSFRANRWIRR